MRQPRYLEFGDSYFRLLTKLRGFKDHREVIIAILVNGQLAPPAVCSLEGEDDLSFDLFH